MRPAHCAREATAMLAFHSNLPFGFNEARALCAGSERPEVVPRRLVGASMRPAHCAREAAKWETNPLGGAARFNEARALCAGSSVRDSTRAAFTETRFNEARALCAGSAPLRPESSRPGRARFNEARALCAGSTLRRNPHHKQLVGGHCESLALLPNLVQSQAVDGTDSSP